MNAFLARNALVLLGLSMLAVGLIVGRGWREGRTLRPMLTLFVLFLPNSSYLITELAHLRETSRAVPVWYDVIAVLSLTMCGILLCCVSLAYVQLILDRAVVGTTWSWVIVSACLVLANFGTHLGRGLRLNSWDPMTRPGHVLASVGRPASPAARVSRAPLARAVASPP
jgi:uncharacterized membrane protein